MRRLAQALAVIALVGAAAFSAAPASASTDETEAGTAVYAVDISDVSTGPEGESTEETSSGELRIACVGTVCAIVSEPARLLLGGAPFTTAETLASERDSGQTGSPCAGGRGARTVSIEATADGFSATLVQQPIDWVACDDDTEAFGHAREVLWTGALVSADPCVFTETGCVATVSASQLASGNPAAPSVFSALATPAEAGTAPQQLITAVLLTIILVLLIAFPTSLLNSAVETGSERMSGWWAARRRRDAQPIGPAIESIPAEDSANAEEASANATDVVTSPETPATADEAQGEGEPLAHPEASRPPKLRQWWWAASGVALAALISAFVDPEFGFNPGSVRVVLSLLASFAVDVALGWFLVIWVMRRLVPGATHTFLFRPATLLVVVAAVVFSRLTGFEPGIVFGLVAGVAFGALAGKGSQARGALVTLGYAFIVALAAWTLYGVILAGGAATGASFWSTFLIETLSAIAVGGMAALPVALFPVRGMAGYAIWSWSRWVWAACYAVGLFAFFVVLMPMPFAWAGVTWDLAAWIAVYLAYAIGAVLAWLLITRPWRHDEEADIEEADAPAGDVEPEASDAVR